MKSGFENMLQEKISPNVIDEIFSVEAKIYKKPTEKLGNVAPVPLFKFLDAEYYAQILIGSPGQKFNVVFDTEWPITWVPSVLCPSFQIPCALRRKYDGNRSSKSVNLLKSYKIPVGSSNLTGLLWMDDVHVNTAGVTNQTFLAASHIPWSMVFSKVDGVVGLAPNNDALPNALPLFQNLIRQNKIQKNMFSVYLNRDPHSSKGGTILFGGIDPKHYNGSFTYLKVDPKTKLWSFIINKIYMGNTTVCSTGCNSLLDTSSNFITGPSKDIENFNKFLNTTYLGGGHYMVDCGNVNKLPPLYISMGGRDFKLKGEDYVQELEIGPFTFCLSLLVSSTDPFWTLGGAFMSRYYVTFDMENYKVGFANAQ